jgi:hypothetical protein
VIAAREGQGRLELVVDDEHPGEPVPGVHRRPVEAMVVVPLERGAFGAPVLGQVVDVAFALAGPDQKVVAGGTRREVLGDVAVLGEGLRPGQAAGLAVELGAVVAAVQVDAQFADRGRELVAEGDLGALTGRPPDRRAGEAAAEGPEPGPRAGEDRLLGRADRDLQPRRGQLRRDRQRGTEGDGGLGGPGPVEVGERAAQPAAGKGDEEGAAAQGTEERPAPQAGRFVWPRVRQLTAWPGVRP